jgi:hypothetical protein
MRKLDPSLTQISIHPPLSGLLSQNWTLLGSHQSTLSALFESTVQPDVPTRPDLPVHDLFTFSMGVALLIGLVFLMTKAYSFMKTFLVYVEPLYQIVASPSVRGNVETHAVASNIVGAEPERQNEPAHAGRQNEPAHAAAGQAQQLPLNNVNMLEELVNAINGFADVVQNFGVVVSIISKDEPKTHNDQPISRPLKYFSLRSGLEYLFQFYLDFVSNYTSLCQ